MYSIIISMLGTLALTMSLISSTVQGVIKNKETQEKIPFATIMLIKDSTTMYKAESNFEGDFKIANVVPDTYSVIVVADGFEKKKIKGFVAKGGIITFINIDLVKLLQENQQKSKRKSKRKQR